MKTQQAQERADAAEETPPRREGYVLVLLPASYESGRTLRPQRDPIPSEEWVAVMRGGSYSASWLPAGAIDTGPYQGGSVVEIAVQGERAYVAVPPEVLPSLAEFMAAADYQMVREDVAALANPQAHGLHVTRLDRTVWEERQQAVPVGASLGTEGWARVIRERRLRVALVQDGLLPLESPWPAGQVVLVCTAEGTQPSYFAVPRTALALAIDLAVETERTPGPVSGA